ncbi:phosphatase [Escherichia phage Mansfield]|uniref:Phosphatase n=1 Tax=Escherichia phage Mansfield TaxID=2591099 RepID=A0A5B9N7B7_9CAUD|nr:phosphatase [Escherichia phage Mansfield]
MSIKSHQILNAFDLDGTLFDDRWRLDRIKVAGPLSDYDDYHSGIGYDQFYPDIASSVESATLRGESVEYWTARPKKYRQATFERLDNVFPFDEFIIKMRDDGDKRPSMTIKSKWLQYVLRHGDYRIINVFDDRQDILAAMRKEAMDYNSMAQNKIAFTFNLCKAGEVVQQLAIDPSATGQEENKAVEIEQSPATAADILDAMAATFRERNAVYGDNAVMVGQVMQVLFPNGVTLKTPEDYHMWHLFELKIVKLTRFAISGLKHEDSIHDDGVYSAMCERLVNTHNINFNK